LAVPKKIVFIVCGACSCINHVCVRDVVVYLWNNQQYFCKQTLTCTDTVKSCVTLFHFVPEIGRILRRKMYLSANRVVA